MRILASILLILTLSACEKEADRHSVHIYIPHAFSPTFDDGLNDTWGVYINDYNFVLESVKIQVSTTDGFKLFESNDPNTTWDGTHNGRKMPTGQYLYFVKLNFKDGDESIYRGVLALVE